MTKPNDFKSYSLFNDIADTDLRNRNRAVVLANIAESAIDRKTKRITAKGAALILGYFGNVEEADRADVQQRFSDDMHKRGFALVA